MPAPRIEQAQALVIEVQAALDAAELTGTLATLDATDVPSGSRRGVVVVAVPELTFETWGDPTALWELHVIAGPATDFLAAWEKIDGIIHALATAQINIKTGSPVTYQPHQGPALSAYTLTLNPLD